VTKEQTSLIAITHNYDNKLDRNDTNNIDLETRNLMVHPSVASLTARIISPLDPSRLDQLITIHPSRLSQVQSWSNPSQRDRHLPTAFFRLQLGEEDGLSHFWSMRLWLSWSRLHGQIWRTNGRTKVCDNEKERFFNSGYSTTLASSPPPPYFLPFPPHSPWSPRLPSKSPPRIPRLLLRLVASLNFSRPVP